MRGPIAWQSWIVIVLAGCAFAIAQVLDPSSGVTIGAGTAILLKTLALVIPLAVNQLKAIGSDTPSAPPTQAEKPPQ